MFSFFKRFKKTQEPIRRNRNRPTRSKRTNRPKRPRSRPARGRRAASAAQPAAPAVVMTVTPTNDGRDEVVETVEIVPPPLQDATAKKSWLARLKTAAKTPSITGVFVNTKIDEDLYEELETALLMSDAGVDATSTCSARCAVRTGRLTDPQQVKSALHDLLVELLTPLEKSLMLGRAHRS